MAARRQQHGEPAFARGDGLAWKARSPAIRAASNALRRLHGPESGRQSARFRYFSGAEFACMHPLFDRIKSTGRPFT
jgi:hypothetical protein